MDLTEFIIRTTPRYYGENRTRIVCKDGFSMSVQASEGHYCIPRENSLRVYAAMEIGFPSKEEYLLRKYKEQNYRKTDYRTIYPYTPVEAIEKIIAKHGGIDEEKTFFVKNYPK